MSDEKSKRVVFRMRLDEHKKNSVKFKAVDDIGDDCLRTMYFMRTGWKELGEPKDVEVTIQPK